MTMQNQAQKKPVTYTNPQEVLRNVGSTGDAIAQDILRQKDAFEGRFAQAQRRGPINREVVAFSKDSYQETHLKRDEIRAIQETIAAIQREVREIKAYSAGVSEEVSKIERATMQALPSRIGVYHVRYYELMLQYLRGIKAKVGEAKTWLMAMQSKKAKRGSAYAVRTKKLGTQYSLSQEQQLARSVG